KKIGGLAWVSLMHRTCGAYGTFRSYRDSTQLVLRRRQEQRHHLPVHSLCQPGGQGWGWIPAQEQTAVEGNHGIGVRRKSVLFGQLGRVVRLRAPGVRSIYKRRDEIG